jgi:CxxC-x17-CxxC domain-containing protein
MDYQDRELICADCRKAFNFSAGEQEFFARKGFRETPKRCKPCRDGRKARRNGNGNGASDGEAAAERPAREMFEVACGQCGGVASVPFRPTPGRPVYCRDCFQARAGL